MHIARICRLSLYVLVAALSLPSTGELNAQTAVLTTVDGGQIHGDIAKWSTEEVSLTVSGETRKYATKELLNLEFQGDVSRDLESAQLIELVDGTRLPITEFTLSDRIATIHTPIDPASLTLPAAQVRFVQFLPVANQSQAWQRAALTGDVLVITKKDSAETEALAGVINNVDLDKVDFTWEGDAIPVKLTKIAGLGFYHAGNQDLFEPMCWLALESGARLAVREIGQETNRLHVTTVTGLEVHVSLEDVISADYSIGKLTYLSDIEPLISKWTPLVALPRGAESIQNYGAPRRNLSFRGSPLTLLWPTNGLSAGERLKTYNKGLAIRSRTELEYRLPRGMRRFVATAGIDPETLKQGNALLTIEVDGKVVFDDTISGTKPPTEIDVDIADKQLLTVIVDYGDNLDLGDLVHLVEARLIK